MKFIPTLAEVCWSLKELTQAQLSDKFCITKAGQLGNKVINTDNGVPTGIVGLNIYLYLKRILYTKRKIDNNNLIVRNIVVPTSLIEMAINSIHYVMHADLKHILFQFGFRYFHQY